MLQVSDITKDYFQDDSIMKRLYINVNGTVYTNEKIYFEEFTLKETIIDSTIEFVGCISNEMDVKIQVDNAKESAYQYLPITASICAITGYNPDGSEVLGEIIPLFAGYIDSAKKDNDRKWLSLTCYDALYYKGSMNVYNWYKKLPWGKKGMTLRRLRDELLYHLGLQNADPDIELPNDEVKVTNRYKKYKDLTALQVLQGLCQINGAFGRINREGKFAFTYIEKGSIYNKDGAYPSNFYPGLIYPGQTKRVSPIGNIEYIPYYREVTYQDTVIKPLVNGVTLRTNSETTGVTSTGDYTSAVDWDDVSDDGNLVTDEDDVITGTYAIEGNMFAYKLSKKKQKQMAANIAHRLGDNDIAFREYNGKSNGLPYIEVGDRIVYTNREGKLREFIVTNRTLKGIQSMTDTYEAHVDDSESNVDSTTSASDYVSQGQACVSSSGSSTANAVSDQLNGQEVMIVVSWDASTGILETSSTHIQQSSE